MSLVMRLKHSSHAKLLNPISYSSAHQQALVKLATSLYGTNTLLVYHEQNRSPENIGGLPHLLASVTMRRRR